MTKKILFLLFAITCGILTPLTKSIASENTSVSKIKEDYFSCIPEPSYKKSFNINSLRADLKESLPENIDELLERLTDNPSLKETYRDLFQIAGQKHQGELIDYFPIFQPFLPLIQEASLKVCELVKQNPLSKVIFLGRSPFWIFEISELLKGKNERLIMLPFSGTPDVSLNGFKDDESDQDQIISEAGLLQFFTLMKTKGIGDDCPYFVVDHLGSGRSMISFYRIFQGFYKYIDRSAPTLTLIDMCLGENEDKNGRFWAYSSHDKMVRFTVSKHVSPVTEFTMSVIPLDMNVNLLALVDFGLFEEDCCNIPKYPAIAWEAPYQDVVIEGEFGLHYQGLRNKIKEDLTAEI